MDNDDLSKMFEEMLRMSKEERQLRDKYPNFPKYPKSVKETMMLCQELSNRV